MEDEIVFDDEYLNFKAGMIMGFLVEVSKPGIEENMLESYGYQGILIAEKILEVCLPDLQIIKERVDINNESFKKLNDSIGVISSKICKTNVAVLFIFARDPSIRDDEVKSQNFINKLNHSEKIFEKILSLDLTQYGRDFISEHKSSIEAARKEFNSPNTGNCYIATHIYGDYNSNEVLILRGFRDKYLLNNFLGRSFVKFYYKISPSTISLFGKNNFFNNSCRWLLNLFINIVKLKTNKSCTSNT